MKPLWIAWLLGLLASASSCGGGEQPAPGNPLEEVFRRQAQEEGMSRSQTEGKRIFAHYCVTCHGDEGHGDGQNAYNLDPTPPDFETSLGQNPSSYWRAIIEGGTASVGRSPICPPWGRTLNGASIDNLVSYLELLAESKSAQPSQAPEEEAPEAEATPAKD